MIQEKRITRMLMQMIEDELTVKDAVGGEEASSKHVVFVATAN
jgi:hypothetical protein